MGGEERVREARFKPDAFVSEGRVFALCRECSEYREGSALFV